MAFVCLDSPEAGPKGTVEVPRDASLFSLKKAIATQGGLLLQDAPAEGDNEEEDEEEQQAPPPAVVRAGDITAPAPPDLPASHELSTARRPKVLDFGLGIVDAAGRQFFSNATEAKAEEAGGLATVLGIEVEQAEDGDARTYHVVLIRFGAKARGLPLSEEPLMHRGTAGRLATFFVTPAWVPPQCPMQTDRGMATFLSSLCVVTEKLSAKGGAEAAARGDKLCQHLELASGCPLGALALRALLDGRVIGSLEKAALSAAIFRCTKRLTAGGEAGVPDERLFEQTRAGLDYLLALAPQQVREAEAGAGGRMAQAREARVRQQLAPPGGPRARCRGGRQQRRRQQLGAGDCGDHCAGAGARQRPRRQGQGEGRQGGPRGPRVLPPRRGDADARPRPQPHGAGPARRNAGRGPAARA